MPLEALGAELEAQLGRLRAKVMQTACAVAQCTGCVHCTCCFADGKLLTR